MNDTIEEAKKYLNLTETDDYKVLMELFKKTLKMTVDPRVTPWCAAFVNAIEISLGRPGTKSLAARSFLKYGKPTNNPQVGDIVIFKRGLNPFQGHVAYVYKIDGDKIITLGGNQNNKVCLGQYDISHVIGYRHPDSNMV